MKNSPSDIIQRIQSGNWNDSDLEVLPQLLQNNDNETLQQLGKFNVSIDDGREIHIGDRNYFNWSDEAIQAVVEVVQAGKAVAVFNPTGKVTIYNYNNYYREETTTVSVELTEETDNLPCPYRGLFHFTSIEELHIAFFSLVRYNESARERKPMPTRSRASKNSYETQFKTNSDRDRDRDQKIPKKRKMKAYSTDLRQKIIDVYLQEKLSQRQLAERFCVALSFIQKLLKQYRTTG
ncbi:MAG: transposase [Limnoraphis sp. WC205]|jgi:hypothetical protein|nr:transposase [Limnoraphis sp. WC205]